MKAKEKILLHKDELERGGVEVMSLRGLSFVERELHRDDHYMFIVQTDGHFICEVDFNKLEIRNTAILYVAPGQVHRYLKAKKCEGWLLFVKPDFISSQFRTVFDTALNITQNIPVAKNNLIFACTDNLEKWWADQAGNDEFKFSVGKSLLDAVLGMIASELKYTSIHSASDNSSKYILAARFKQLIKEKFKELKQVKQYASLLHITPLYLNEVMNDITGFSASYWIYQEIILEAKRLLVYTERDVREIAWELGFEDDAYFSRFFKKNTGITASLFRAQKP